MPAAPSADQQTLDREALLDATEALVYSRGIHAVGVDRIREASGLSLKRIYAMYPAKEDMVVAALRRRDHRWRSGLAAHTDDIEDATQRTLALFDWLTEWFDDPGFRGCAWVNIHAELGTTSPAVLAEVRRHKAAFQEQVIELVAPAPKEVAEQIYLLAEGAIVACGINRDPRLAQVARAAAERLLASTRQS